jgi:hypothetical protein
MARPRVSKSVEGEVTNTMTKVRHMVRVLSRGAAPDPEHGFFSAREVEKEIESMIQSGWNLMGQPQFTGMEGFGVDPNAGFRMLYFFTKEE